ncbi:MAG: RagB/SusD family nutrient uptake outer membrane protein [Paramuribaculum sp.]|nr:RagB/SusD family nutrient uptake outer membrane protein [Paramuribaculum sp.]
MKSLNKYILIGALGFTAVACNDLDTEPLGSTVTSEQKENVVARDPEMLSAGTNAVPTMLKQFGNILGTSSHMDFGYPAIMLGLDSRTADMPSLVLGYNWFSEQIEMSDINTTSRLTRMIWGTMYNQIFSANNVLSVVDLESEDPEVMYFAAQALGFRANAYFVLAQLYQYTYFGHQNDPCVPIITNENSDEVALNGAPRATVEEVYALINKDIDKCIEFLEATKTIAFTARADKAFFSASSAHGLRARINLVQHKYTEAIADAEYAITNSKMTPYAANDIKKPGFWNAADKSWLWAVIVDESDRVVTTGICNWPSMASTFCRGGYTSVGAWRKGNMTLVEGITSSDVRKGWWLDANGQSPNLVSPYTQAFVSNAIQDPATPEYVNVKFGIYQDNMTNTQTPANDIPLMRIEEMYLIKAEAQAMSGDVAGGCTTLVGLVSRYRDPNYAFSNGSADVVMNEIWRQRRIEFWGEGIAYYDIMRLNKGIDRRGGGFEPANVYNIPAGDPILLFQIPQTEVESNKALGANNPTTVKPTPVADI